MTEQFATEEHVKIAVLESEKSSREQNDKIYAPAHVKTIVYWFTGILAASVLGGMVNSFSGNFIKSFGGSAKVQTYDNGE